jgi:hypothetical protein
MVRKPFTVGVSLSIWYLLCCGIVVVVVVVVVGGGGGGGVGQTKGQTPGVLSVVGGAWWHRRQVC